jgi:hypothetical protein
MAAFDAGARRDSMRSARIDVADVLGAGRDGAVQRQVLCARRRDCQRGAGSNLHPAVAPLVVTVGPPTNTAAEPVF